MKHEIKHDIPHEASEHRDYPGNLFMVVAPSGAGKSTLVNALLAQDPDICLSVSFTTRAPRPGEQDGQAYHFVSVEEFLRRRRAGEFLESAEVHGNYYATSRLWIEEQMSEGRDVLLEIDWQGAQQVRKKFRNAVGIFILPPSIAALEERLKKRGQDEPNVIARRLPIPVFGAGLVEAIPDEVIAALEDPDDRDGDGISGRAAWITDVVTGRARVGRFGWKSQHATLLAFSADAYRNEMGITNDLFPDEVALGIEPELLALCSPPRKGLEDVRDRRTGLRGIDNFENFMRLLAPVPRGLGNDLTHEGERIFRSIGCATCHVPTLRTGRSANPVFDRKAVDLYSDLLLHDVGSGDGIEQASAGTNEIRTPALWGLRLRRPFLHDGSAATVDEAIRRHRGEATAVTERYSASSEEQRHALLAFLRSL